jgi:hypothetical protein
MTFNRLTWTGLALRAALVLPGLAGAACVGGIAADAPAARYTVSGDTVTDVASGLVWKLCSEGQSGSACAGTAEALTWQGALQRVQSANTAKDGGFADWRLPNRAELASLVEHQCTDPAINSAVFPATLAQSYWTASPYARDTTLAWAVNFSTGDVLPAIKTTAKRVRLVRAGKF